MSQLLTVSNFGHSGPIFSMAGRIMIDAGLPIGSMPEPDPYPEVAQDLATHGKRCMIFTDGVTEQFDPHGDMFGEEGLEREVSPRNGSPFAGDARADLRVRRGISWASAGEG